MIFCGDLRVCVALWLSQVRDAQAFAVTLTYRDNTGVCRPIIITNCSICAALVIARTTVVNMSEKEKVAVMKSNLKCCCSPLHKNTRAARKVWSLERIGRDVSVSVFAERMAYRTRSGRWVRYRVHGASPAGI